MGSAVQRALRRGLLTRAQDRASVEAAVAAWLSGHAEAQGMEARLGELQQLSDGQEQDLR